MGQQYDCESLMLLMPFVLKMVVTDDMVENWRYMCFAYTRYNTWEVQLNFL